jgi:hypothetical protein
MQYVVHYWRERDDTLFKMILITTALLIGIVAWAIGSAFNAEFALPRSVRQDAAATVHILNLICPWVLLALMAEVLCMAGVLELHHMARARRGSLFERTAFKVLVISLSILWLMYYSNGSASLEMVALWCIWGLGLLGTIVGTQIAVRSAAPPALYDRQAGAARALWSIVMRSGGDALLVGSSALLVAMFWGDPLRIWFGAVYAIGFFFVLGFRSLPDLWRKITKDPELP